MRTALIFDHAALATSSPSENLRETITDIRRSLGAIPVSVSRPLAAFARRLKRARPDVVFNLCESIDGNPDGEPLAAAWLELLEVPFTGNSARALRTALDKGRTREVLREAGVPIPHGWILDGTADIRQVRFPAIVKPRHEDASIGIDRRSVVGNRRALAERVRTVNRRLHQDALVEEYIDGNEYNVALMKGRVLAISEIRFSITPRIVTYDAKWKTGSVEDRGTTPVCPARLTPRKASRIAAIATSAAAAVGCTGHVRVDMRNEYVIDVNPNPDLSRHAGFARCARAAGMDYDSLLRTLIHDAHPTPRR